MIIINILILQDIKYNGKIDNLTTQELQRKIELDTKVKLSKNYFKVSAFVLIGGVLLKSINKNWTILGASGSLAASGTTTYYLAKHLLYVSKRTRFYKKHKLNFRKKRKE